MRVNLRIRNQKQPYAKKDRKSVDRLRKGKKRGKRKETERGRWPPACVCFRFPIPAYVSLRIRNLAFRLAFVCVSFSTRNMHQQTQPNETLLCSLVFCVDPLCYRNHPCDTSSKRNQTQKGFVSQRIRKPPKPNASKRNLPRLSSAYIAVPCHSKSKHKRPCVCARDRNQTQGPFVSFRLLSLCCQNTSNHKLIFLCQPKKQTQAIETF